MAFVKISGRGNNRDAAKHSASLKGSAYQAANLRLAIAALRHLLIDPGLLHHMKVPILRQPANRSNGAVNYAHGRHAGADCKVIEKHGANAASGATSTIFGASKA